MSPYARAARVTLFEKGVDYEFIPIGPNELQAPDYALRHPFRKLPVLEVHGTNIFETVAIMGFIDRHGSNAKSLRPSDGLACAHCDQWMSAANSYLYDIAFTRFFFPKALAPQLGMPVDLDLVEAAVEPLARHLEIVEHAISAAHLATPQLTLADIFVGAIYAPLLKIGDGQRLLEVQPRTAAWITDLSVRDSFKATDT